MEPVWDGRAGRSPRETAEWIRYEALANLLFAPLATTALCAYDTRTAGAAIVAAARRAHPGTGAYVDPVTLAAELDAVPLPEPPADAQHLHHPDPDALCAGAVARGLSAADAELFAGSVLAAAASSGRSPARCSGAPPRLRLRAAHHTPRRRPARRVHPAARRRTRAGPGAVVRPAGLRVRRCARRRGGGDRTSPVRVGVRRRRYGNR